MLFDSWGRYNWTQPYFLATLIPWLKSCAVFLMFKANAAPSPSPNKEESLRPCFRAPQSTRTSQSGVQAPNTQPTIVLPPHNPTKEILPFAGKVFNMVTPRLSAKTGNRSPQAVRVIQVVISRRRQPSDVFSTKQWPNGPTTVTSVAKGPVLYF